VVRAGLRIGVFFEPDRTTVMFLRVVFH
jgi:hypothetical protein